VQDAIITGLNQKDVGAMIFTTPKIKQLGHPRDNATLTEILQGPEVQAFFQHLINQLVAQATGSASRIARMLVLDTPPSIDHGEITDKGSINQRAVLKQRDALVRALHADQLPQIFKPQGH
jgi:feruloyl-CoA synthase